LAIFARSNIVTWFLPLKSGRSLSSALIARRFLASCKPFRLMYDHSLLMTCVRGCGLLPITAASCELGVRGFMNDGLGVRFLPEADFFVAFVARFAVFFVVRLALFAAVFRAAGRFAVFLTDFFAAFLVDFFAAFFLAAIACLPLSGDTSYLGTSETTGTTVTAIRHKQYNTCAELQ
jgi:hypothetical protein